MDAILVDFHSRASTMREISRKRCLFFFIPRTRIFEGTFYFELLEQPRTIARKSSSTILVVDLFEGREINTEQDSRDVLVFLDPRCNGTLQLKLCIMVGEPSMINCVP